MRVLTNTAGQAGTVAERPAYALPMATFPRSIEVVRGPNNGVQLFIDGQEFPYAISAADPVEVSIDRTSAPGVRLTLMASTVGVTDDLFADAYLEHECSDETEDQS